jgi:hypothetical protein
VAPGGPVISGTPGNASRVVVALRQASPVSLEVARLGISAGPAEGMRGGADHTASTAGVALAGLPATAAVAEGSLQAVTVDVVVRGGRSPVADIGGAGAVIDLTDLAIMSDGDVGKGTAAVDAFFSARQPEGGTGLHAGTGGSAGVAAAFGDFARALGLEDGRGTRMIAGPVAGNLPTGSPVLFALLGAAWGSRAEEREARRQRRRLRG